MVAVESEDDENEDEDEDEDEDEEEDEDDDEDADEAAGRSQHETVPSSAPDATKTPLCAYATRGTSSGSVTRLDAEAASAVWFRCC